MNNIKNFNKKYNKCLYKNNNFKIILAKWKKK